MIKTKTVAYLRVSTDSQADKGFSLQAQEEKVKQYAALYDLELIDIVIDAGASAKSIDRPGLKRALGMLKVSHCYLHWIPCWRYTRNCAMALAIVGSTIFLNWIN